MAATTTQRPPALPATPNAKTPTGASKMSKIYLDGNGVPQKSLHPVPVDEDNRRTAHVLHQCPHLAVINGGGKERCSDKEWLLPETNPRFCPSHGKRLEKADRGPSQLELTAKAAVAMHGRSALPWALPAAAGLADLAMHLADVNALAVGGAAPLAGGVAYLAVKRTLTKRAVARRRIEKGQRDGKRYLAILRDARMVGLHTAEFGVWGSALAATDVTHWPGRIVAAAGMVRWAVGMRGWWCNAEERRTRGPEVTVDVTVIAGAAAVEAPDQVRLQAVATWATIIGCAGGPLAGTEITEFKRLPACEVNVESRTMLPNWSAKVIAKVDGTINMRESRPLLLGRIAAAFKCTYADVSFSADESDLSIGWLRVQPDNPLAETRMWTGSGATDWKRGVSIVGRFDDALNVMYQWWTKTGAVHDLISGCTGSGKSELVAQLILASLHSAGLVLDWVGDPQGGQSYGVLKEAVDWFARDKSEIKLMLLAAVKEMQRRNDELSRNNIKTWFATKAMPLLVITLDEVQSYIEDPDILALVEMLVGQARKCGIKMRLITQIPAAYNLGGSTYIKEQLKAGQTLIFRAMTDVAGRSATDGDVPVDPTMLPLVWGKNTCAAGETTAGLMFAQGLNGRDVYGRADYTGDEMKVWLVDANGDPSITPGVFGREAQQESGVLWGDRKERARRLLEAGRSDEDLLPNGRALELIEQAAVAAVSQQPLRAPDPGQAKLPDRARDKVLRACREVANEDGVADKKDVVRVLTGLVAPTTVSSTLTDLVADLSLGRVKNGFYRVPGLAQARRDEAEAVAS